MITLTHCPVPHLQDEREFNDFLKLYEEKKPEKIMEIGSFYGATLWAWVANNPSLKRLIALDLPIPISDGRYSQMLESRSMWNSWMQGIEFHDIIGDSHSNQTLIEIGKLVPKDSLDMLFIDGDHSYEGVKQDWQMYHTRVKDGGWVVFHDSVGYDSVKRLCDELRAEGWQNQEISHPGGWGLFIVTI